MLISCEPARGISATTPPGEKQNVWLSRRSTTAWSVSTAVVAAAAGILSPGHLSEFLCF
jgi:hypothetical protein